MTLSQPLISEKITVSQRVEDYFNSPLTKCSARIAKIAAVALFILGAGAVTIAAGHASFSVPIFHAAASLAFFTPTSLGVLGGVLLIASALFTLRLAMSPAWDRETFERHTPEGDIEIYGVEKLLAEHLRAVESNVCTLREQIYLLRTRAQQLRADERALKEETEDACIKDSRECDEKLRLCEKELGKANKELHAYDPPSVKNRARQRPSLGANKLQSRQKNSAMQSSSLV